MKSNYILPIDLAPDWIPFGVKSIEKCHYNPNLLWFTKISKRFLCVMDGTRCMRMHINIYIHVSNDSHTYIYVYIYYIYCGYIYIYFRPITKHYNFKSICCTHLGFSHDTKISSFFIANNSWPSIHRLPQFCSL